MKIGYKIISAITDSTTLSISAKGCEQIGTRKDEHGNSIPIIRCKSVTIAILIADLPEKDKLSYIKTQIEAAYDALPSETLIKALMGKTWQGQV
jgi:hypothetical protein